MAKKKVDWRVVCVALVCISVIEIYALSQGVNGVLLSTVLVIIAGLAGFMIPSPINTK